MRTINFFRSIAVILLGACCGPDYDSTVPPGYPYTPGIQELNYQIYNNRAFGLNTGGSYSYYHPLENRLIRDTLEFKQYFKALDSNMKCDIDFSKYDLTNVKGNIQSAIGVGFQIRSLINHNEKKCIVEMRATANYCSGSGNGDYFVDDLIIIPKVPASYTYELRKYSPVSH